jgi:MFS transporter, ACS family, glucarate transporter
MAENDQSPMARNSRPDAATRIRYAVLAVGCSLALLAYIHRQSYVRGQTEIAADLGLNNTQRGYLAAAFLVAYGLFQVPCGLLGDRLGARHLLTVLMLGSSLLTGATALAAYFPKGPWQFPFLFGVRLLFGAFQAGIFPVWSRVLTDWMPSLKRASAQGTVWMFSRFGGAISPFLFLWMFEFFETWTVPFWILGGLGLVWCAFFWLWFRDRPEQMPKVNLAERELIALGRPLAVAKSPPIHWGAFLRSTNIWALCLMYGFVGFAGNFITNLLPNYLKDHRHLSAQEVTRLTALPLAVGVISCASGGLLSDWVIRRWKSRKWGRRLNAMAGLSLAGSTLLAVPWAEPVWLLAFLLSASFFFNDLNMGPAWAACADVGESYAGTISGAMNMAGNFIGAVGMTFAGMMLDGGHIQLLFIVFACSYALAALCWLAVDVTKPLRFEHNPAPSPVDIPRPAGIRPPP